jgi:hypothetical protein|tara:strand:+ start:820 stop:1551 length:732 start_codon:yes stop_codon:yes gene_type:complete
VAVKKVRRRRRKGTGKRKNYYFDETTQLAIVEFQECEDQATRDAIYTHKILPSFEKLVENLILIYRFARGGETFHVLKNDCVTFLYETLYKFDNSKGTKAFSYFNVVGKNWLILNSRRKKRLTDNHVSLSYQETLSHDDRLAVASHQIAPAPDELMISAEFRQEIMETLLKIKDRVDSKNDISCINAIILVFETVDQLDFLNKRAIFVYVRDISGLNSKQLSAAMSSIRKLYREIKNEKTDLF